MTEQDKVREHSFDGIQEYDNRLPNWWLAILYGSIVFSLIYWIWFHTLGVGALPRESFATEISFECPLSVVFGRPVAMSQTAPRSTLWRASTSVACRHGSPMSIAASAERSISATSGAVRRSSISCPYCSCRSTQAMAAELREAL